VIYLTRTLHFQENTEVSAAMISIQQSIYRVFAILLGMYRVRDSYSLIAS